MKIFWTQSARQSRNALVEYIANDNIHAALELDTRISVAASRLADFPQLGKMGRIEGSRELVIHKHYILVYDIVEEDIVILAILHTSQQFDNDRPIRSYP